jgi:hypothetical protein
VIWSATSTFLQVTFATLIVAPIVVLWIVAVLDVVRHSHSGLKVAAMLVLILVVPILGPLLYFAFFRPRAPASAEAAYMAEADLRRERARQPIGGMGPT